MNNEQAGEKMGIEALNHLEINKGLYKTGRQIYQTLIIQEEKEYVWFF